MLERYKEGLAAMRQSKERGVSIRRRIVLYWACMALAALSAALFLLSVTGVVSHSSRQLGETLELQQENNASLLISQFDALTARGITLSEQLSEEINSFLASRGLRFEQLNDDPDRIAELESTLMPILNASLGGSACSGVYFLLDVTANTALDGAEHSRAGLYLRYSSLRSANPAGGSIVLFRGTVAAARQEGVQMHNRWNPEINTKRIPGYRQLMASRGKRLSESCLWTGRIPLPDTWEDVALLCVPVLDEGGNVRGICGMEMSDLYFTLAHNAVSSPYGSLVTVLAPLDGDALLLDRAMLGDTKGSTLSASGTLHLREGKFFDTFSAGETSFLGKYCIIPEQTADGLPLAAVTLVEEASFRSYDYMTRVSWILGSLFFLLIMLAVALLLSHHFAKPITQSLAAVKTQHGTDVPRSGIAEIDELVAFLRDHPQTEYITQERLPEDVEVLIKELTARAATLTSTERAVLKNYVEGYTVKDIPERMFISAGTAKAHNRNIYRKLNVDSYDALKVYIDVLIRCGRIDELVNKTE